MENNKHIVMVTGTRADFGKIEPLAITLRDAGFRISFFTTGMHQMARYGLTRNEVHKTTGVAIFDFENQAEGDPLDTILARTITGFSDYCRTHKPDLVVVHGDRIEALACSLVCATNYIRCAHIEGGEVSGTIDEIFRHCNTKLASDHFVSSQSAANRVRALGETTGAIRVIGSPELDSHSAPTGLDLGEVLDYYDIKFDDYGIVIFHPVTSEQDTIGNQARDLFNALRLSGRNFVVILPNNDPGSAAIFAVLEGLPSAQFRTIPSMRFAYFSELLRHAKALIGNSSAGVREAPFLGIPSLNIGTRQTNRAQADSIVNCAADAGDMVADFLANHWGRDWPRDTEFGKGDSAGAFLRVLQDPEFWQRSLQKVFDD